MRLIDKDRLLKGSNHYWLEMENFGDIESIDVRFVEMAEEVKAIPIEWIKSKINAILDSYPDGNEETEILCKLLYEWEKENANNN